MGIPGWRLSIPTGSYNYLCQCIWPWAWTACSEDTELLSSSFSLLLIASPHFSDFLLQPWQCCLGLPYVDSCLERIQVLWGRRQVLWGTQGGPFADPQAVLPEASSLCQDIQTTRFQVQLKNHNFSAHVQVCKRCYAQCSWTALFLKHQAQWFRRGLQSGLTS